MEPVGPINNKLVFLINRKRMSISQILGLILCCSAFALVGCKSEAAPATISPPKPTKELRVPVFNRDTAYYFVQRQVDFGHRHMGSPGHEACKDWIIAKLESYDVSVTTQEFTATLFDGSSHPATNIIGKINPTNTNRILLAAHWDSRQMAEKDPDASKRNDPILGADDGGSGVAVLLEMARTLQTHPIDLGLDLVFFDAEDAGANGGGREETWCLGSQHYARNVPNPTPRYGILLDMVGSKGATFPQEGWSLQYAPNVVQDIWKLANSMGYGHYFVNTRVPGLVDDHLFVNQIGKIPMIDIINYANNSFGSYHHTHDDNMDIIDRRTLGVVGQVVLAYLAREDAGML